METNLAFHVESEDKFLEIKHKRAELFGALFTFKKQRNGGENA